QTLFELAADAPRRQAMSTAAGEGARRYAWPLVAGAVLTAYEDAIRTPAPQGGRERVAVALGARSADLGPRQPARRRLETLEREQRTPRSRMLAHLRRLAVVATVLAIAAICVLAVEKIGPGRIASA